MNVFLKLMRLSIILITVCIIVSCAKFLAVKPDETLAVPDKLEDFEGLMDEFTVMNTTLPTPSAIFSDDYYVLDNDWKALTNITDRNFYLWKSDGDYKTVVNREFRAILYTNLVLDGLGKVKPTDRRGQSIYDRLKGTAYFHRAFRYYILAVHHAPHPRSILAMQVKLPLRLTSDNSSKSKLVPVNTIYEQIVSDLKKSTAYLPETALLPARPSKAAAYGQLAKVLLDLGDYEEALQYADSCLVIKNDLIDLNQININAAAPFARFNKEVLFHARSATATILSRNIARVDPQLFNSYAMDDLRAKAFFVQSQVGKVEFKGDYDGRGSASGFEFWGILVPDIMLIKSECLARKGMDKEANTELWNLLKNRFKAGSVNPYIGMKDMLPLVLQERRKELIRKGTRWIDIRRLWNDEGSRIPLVRTIEGVDYSLNEQRLFIEMPQSVLALGE